MESCAQWLDYNSNIKKISTWIFCFDYYLNLFAYHNADRLLGAKSSVYQLISAIMSKLTVNNYELIFLILVQKFDV